MTHVLRNQQLNIVIESLNWSKLEFINVNTIKYENIFMYVVILKVQQMNCVAREYMFYG